MARQKQEGTGPIRRRPRVALAAATAGFLALLPAAQSAPAVTPSESQQDADLQSLIVRFADASSPSQRESIHLAAGVVVQDRIEELNADLVRAPVGARDVYQRSPGVRWVERNRTVRAMLRPNDPMLSDQWGLKLIRAFQAWESERGLTSPVVVAVLDTGVVRDHPDLRDRVTSGFDFVNNDADPDDDHYHGTYVAGIIAARSNNRIGVAGLSWGATIMPVKVLDENGGGSYFSIAAGIVYAASRGARIQNLSLGGVLPSCPKIEQAAISFARQRDSLVIASAGNSAQQGNPLEYPAACEGVLSVAAVGPKARHAPFSTFNRYVDLAAPGEDILSTVPGFVPTPTYGYLSGSGTSAAAPQVAGLAALLLSQHPDWTTDQIVRRMRSTARDVGRKGRDPYFGWGVIDMAKALRDDSSR